MKEHETHCESQGAHSNGSGDNRWTVQLSFFTRVTLANLYSHLRQSIRIQGCGQECNDSQPKRRTCIYQLQTCNRTRHHKAGDARYLSQFAVRFHKLRFIVHCGWNNRRFRNGIGLTQNQCGKRQWEKSERIKRTGHAHKHACSQDTNQNNNHSLTTFHAVNKRANQRCNDSERSHADSKEQQNFCSRRIWADGQKERVRKSHGHCCISRGHQRVHTR